MKRRKARSRDSRPQADEIMGPANVRASQVAYCSIWVCPSTLPFGNYYSNQELATLNQPSIRLATSKIMRHGTSKP